MSADVRVLGAIWCKEPRGVRHRFADIEADAVAAAEVEGRNGGERISPTLVSAGGLFVVEPSDDEFLSRLDAPHRAA